MRIKTATNWIFSLLAFGLMACGGGEHVERSEAGPAVRARVQTVASSSIPLTFEAVGTVQSRTSADLSANIMGQIVGVFFQEGDRVGKGKLLVQIDSRELAAQLEKARAGIDEIDTALEEVESGIAAAQAGLDAARANAELAQSTFDRFEQLLERKSVSRQEYDEAQARSRSAAAEVQRAESMLQAAGLQKQQLESRRVQASADLDRIEVLRSYTRIEAPFAGLITKKMVEMGDLASPGMPLLTLEDGSRYRLWATVPESQLPTIHSGQEVTILVESASKRLEGKVAEIAPYTDPGSRSAIVKLDLPADPLLRSGMYARALFPAGEQQVTVLPREALVLKGQLTGVYALDGEGRARFRLIKVGKAHGDLVEVLSGLGPEDQVVVEKSPQLRDGVSVQPIAG